MSTQSAISAENIGSRSEQIFLEHQRNIYMRTDRLFAWLMGLQWLGAIATALWVSPRAWAGAQWDTHIHVYAAVFLGGVIVALPIILVSTLPGAALTRHVVAVGQMLMSALLIHLTGGRIETHFHVFGSLAFLAFYRDWRVLVSASIVVGMDHLLRGIFWPESVYGVIFAEGWRWLEHVWWVFFEDVFLFMAIHQSILEMRAIAERQAREEQARSEAERANCVKDEFLATLSHELRTPLTSAFGWIAVLRKSTEHDPELFERGLAVFDRNVRSLAKLIDDLLDVSRIVTGKLALDTRPMLLRPVIENALEAVRPAAKAKDIALDCAIPNADLVVRGDAARLQQVAWNLLSNAVKFTPRQGRVKISVAERDGNAVLTVADNGQGIASDFLPHLFERFQQADGSITRRFGGLGLGLAIVRHIAELHGGTVAAASEGVGKGAQFTMTLPVERNAIIVRESRPPDGRRSSMLDGLTVLVVEDDADTRSLITMVLEQCGAKILAASCVTEALHFVEHHNPDVMISDIGMAEEDGYSLIRKVRLREAKSGGHMPAAALTAYAKTEDRAAALAAGFEDHVIKPVEPDRLPALVAELAKRRV